MSDPLTGTGAATAMITSASVIGVVSGLDAGVVIGAFSGAVVFVLVAADMSLWRKLTMFAVSFLLGIISAEFVAGLVNSVSPVEVKAGAPVGAMIAGAMVVRVLMGLSSDTGNVFSLLSKVADALSALSKMKGK